MNIYVVITCCLLEHQKDIRKEQYIKGINQAIKLFQNIENPNIKKIQLLIVENNHIENTKTFLDEFNLPVFYTKNNYINISKNKGYKELKDVNDTVSHFNLNDDDFIIKLTGRYFIEDNSSLIDTLKHINLENYDAILRYGGYNLKEIFKVLAIDNKDSKLPRMIICNTIKGKGISFCENNNQWHHSMLSKALYDKAISEII
jgi:hypothetical protein